MSVLNILISCQGVIKGFTDFLQDYFMNEFLMILGYFNLSSNEIIVYHI